MMEPGSRVGDLVQVAALPGPVPAAPAADVLGGEVPVEAWGERDVGGQPGRCVGRPSLGVCLVRTFGSDLIAQVPPASLAALAPEPPPRGGFDLAWPGLLGAAGGSGGGEEQQFGEDMAEVLATKGYCVVQMYMGQEEQEEARREAARLQSAAEVFREEFEADYLGGGGGGDGRRRSTGAVRLPRDAPGADVSGALARCNRQLTQAGLLLAPHSQAALGFSAYGSWDAFARVPYRGAADATAAAARGQPLDSEDIEAGLVARHIAFVQSRKVCMLHLVENSGGTLQLYPFGGAAAVKLPLAKGRLVLFRHDQMDFEYSPLGESLALQSWVMASTPDFRLDTVDSDAPGLDSAYGITGPQMLDGLHMQIMTMATRLPGEVHAKDMYWNVGMTCVDAAYLWPILRFDMDSYYNEDERYGVSYSNHGCFVAEEVLWCFANAAFQVADAEAMAMSINQRMTCEVAYEALSTGGWTRSLLRGRHMGLYIGDVGPDWHQWTTYGSVNAYSPALSATGLTSAVVPARLSFILDLRGPTMTFDTACSSSLVATHHGHMAMINFNEWGVHCDGAVAGGVNSLGPVGYINTSQGHMGSKLGRCFTFDRTADGYQRGEGACMMHVRLSADWEDIQGRLAVVAGTAANQDGRSASLTAPNGPSQQKIIRFCMRMAGVAEDVVSAVECHGTGTALGDPIEVGAIAGAMDGRDGPLPHTSGKSNVGHLESGAGITGLCKCLCILTRGAATPNVHLAILNSHLTSSGFPQLFDTELLDSGTNAGYCGVSSFGFGGTNSRGDLYGKALRGPNARTEPDLKKVDYVTVPCPRCLGRMCWRCGASTPTWAPKGRHHCSLVRDRADYEYCTNCYDGGFRCGDSIKDLAQDVLGGDAARVLITGTWDAWSSLEEMARAGPGVYTCGVVLGETRVEHFRLILPHGHEHLTFYPSERDGGTNSMVCGPDAGGEGRRWVIDGRRKGIASGTVFAVTFEWGDRVRVSWGVSTGDDPGVVVGGTRRHSYEVRGSWLSWGAVGGGLCQLAPSATEEGTYETSFAIGASGREAFDLLRDRDTEQVIYPAVDLASSPAVPARGPDEWGGGNRWVVHGRPKEVVALRLCVVDGKVALTLRADSFGELLWGGGPGAHARVYYVMGTPTGWEMALMTADPERQGLYRYRVPLDGSECSADGAAAQEDFVIAVDRDRSQVIHPGVPHAGPGEAIAEGPDPNHGGSSWRIIGGHRTVQEIVLDVTQEDRRRVVTWAEVPAGALDERQPLGRGTRAEMLTPGECRLAQQMLKERLSNPDIQQKLAEHEVASGGDFSRFQGRLQRVLMRSVYPDVVEHFGYDNVLEGSRQIIMSIGAACREPGARDLVETWLELETLMRNRPAIERSRQWLAAFQNGID